MEKKNIYQKKAICTIILIAINVIVFFLLTFQGMTEDAEFMLQHGAAYVPYIVEKKEYYRLFSSMFLHFGFEHLMNNMLMLAVIGWNLELEIGKVKFLIIYFMSGFCGNVLSACYEIVSGDFAVSAGASGAIFGIISVAHTIHAAAPSHFNSNPLARRKSPIFGLYGEFMNSSTVIPISAAMDS